jgi:hypothetical protein
MWRPSWWDAGSWTWVGTRGTSVSARTTRRRPADRDRITTPEALTLFVRLFIELGRLRVHLGGCTANPNAACVTQQARDWAGKLLDAEARFRFLVRGRDRKDLCR